jgi:hypothetical protein
VLKNHFGKLDLVFSREQAKDKAGKTPKILTNLRCPQFTLFKKAESTKTYCTNQRLFAHLRQLIGK